MNWRVSSGDGDDRERGSTLIEILVATVIMSSAIMVLVTGMGGELGTRVAQLLEEEPSVTDIVGVDFVPPHVDPTLDRYDVIHFVRGDVLVEIAPIEARGASQ